MYHLSVNNYSKTGFLLDCLCLNIYFESNIFTNLFQLALKTIGYLPKYFCYNCIIKGEGVKVQNIFVSLFSFYALLL